MTTTPEGWLSVADLEQAYRQTLAELERSEAACASAMAEVEALKEDVDALRQHILDIDAHATPYGNLPDEPGMVGTYLLTAGALHRALGKVGHTAPGCQAEADLDRLRTAVRSVLAMVDHGTALPALMHAVVQLRRFVDPEVGT